MKKKLSLFLSFILVLSSLFFFSKCSTTTNNKDADYSTKRKLYCFGDSTVWGAVWDENPDTPLYQAAEQYRIPTRIALATGFTNNFENLGHSGDSYIKITEDSVELGELSKKILDNELTDAGLVFVMGGANDKLKSKLGDSETCNEGTICWAIKKIIDHVKTKAPKATLVICQPMPSGTKEMMKDVWNSKYYYTDDHWSLNDFDNEISKLCRDNHVGYVNWLESSYCDKWGIHSGGYHKGTGPNYSHPKKEEDYELLGDFIGKKIACLK